MIPLRVRLLRVTIANAFEANCPALTSEKALDLSGQFGNRLDLYPVDRSPKHGRQMPAYRSEDIALLVCGGQAGIDLRYQFVLDSSHEINERVRDRCFEEKEKRIQALM